MCTTARISYSPIRYAHAPANLVITTCLLTSYPQSGRKSPRSAADDMRKGTEHGEGVECVWNMRGDKLAST